MIPGFGKAQLKVGNGSDCDVRLGGPGVEAHHLTLERRPGGLTLLARAGRTVLGQTLMPVGSEAPFDLRTSVTLGSGTILPLSHPAITLMLLERGRADAQPGRIRFGRDPEANDVVVHHPNVSGQHATLLGNPLRVVDERSTSGTWLGPRRLGGGVDTPLDPNAVVGFGPVQFTVGLLSQLLESFPSMPAVAGARPRKAPQRARHQTVVGEFLPQGGGLDQTKTVGRTPQNDIQVEHPQVSSRHASLHQVDGKLFVEDHGSANGTFVRGQRIAVGKRVPVKPGEKIFVGPMPLRVHAEAEQVAVVIDDSSAWEGRPLYEIEAWDLVVEVSDRDNPGQQKVLLDHVSFKALPGDFIALMGPSGAGKTTLLLALNGYLPPTHGQVRINGENLYAIYDALRGSIGYVPQDDIVHPELTVWEAVRYSATFRLPPDYSAEEIDRRVSTTLQQLGLESVQHLQIGKPENKILSGGQRKRVNIAMELVTDPVIMFLDEPTSGLAADDTASLIQLLSDLARSTGKTIIATIHQPAKDEFEKFNLALILGQGGVPLFYGPTHPDAYRFFGGFLESIGKRNDVDNPRDMFDMLNQREQHAGGQGITRHEARKAAARQWHEAFFSERNPTYAAMYSGRREVGVGSEAAPVLPTRPSTRGQFGQLFGRYFRIKRRDVGGTAIMLLQAPIIGVLLAMVFGGQEEAIPYWCLGAIQELGTRSGDLQEVSSDLLTSMHRTQDNTAAIFFVTVAAVWFGTSNAAREIVSERAVYLRERMVNLGLFNYVVSKFFLLSLVTVIQCSVLLAMVFFTLGFSGGLPAFGIQLATLVATAMNSIAIGLLLSTVVASSEAAMALTPIALIPQVVLGGLMVPMTTNPLLKWPMYLVPARWGFQGTVAQERLAVGDAPAWTIDLQRPSLNSLDNFIEAGRFHCAEAQIASDELNGAWGFVHFESTWLPVGVLGSMMAVVLCTILVILKRRDRI